MKTIELPVGSIRLKLSESVSGVTGHDKEYWLKSQGTITSDLHDHDPDDQEYDRAIDGLEALILAHACAGVNVQDPQYVEGIQSAVDAITNQLQ